MKVTWTREAIEGLGVRTDLKTACSVAGFCYTNGKVMAREGTLPFPVHRVGAGPYIVPVAGLLQWLGLSQPSQPAVAAAPLRAVQ